MAADENDELSTQETSDAAPGDADLSADGALPATPPTPEPSDGLTQVDAGGDPAVADGQAKTQAKQKIQPFDEVENAMAAAIESERLESSAASPTGGASGVQMVNLPELAGAASATSDAAGQGIDLLRDVQLNVKIELGRSRMLVDDVLRLGEGSVVELDKLAGDPVDVFVNERLIARGEVLVLNDNFCVRINDIVNQYAELDEE